MATNGNKEFRGKLELIKEDEARRLKIYELRIEPGISGIRGSIYVDLNYDALFDVLILKK